MTVIKNFSNIREGIGENLIKRGHKNARFDLTAKYVKSVLDYNPQTGEFTWKVTLSKRATVGKKAGWKRPDGRIGIAINNADYRAHRLAWLVMTGEWPPEEIDHKDGNPSNNKWKNLRLASSSQNQANRKLRRNNKTGITGVCWDSNKNRWLAYINKRHIGLFATFKLAAKARKEAVKRLHKEFAHRDSLLTMK